MKLAGHFLALCFLFGSFALSAQDLHFTLYDYAPLSINPANAGNYEGTYRIGGIYRDQWSAVSGGSSAFRTPMIYVDAPLLAIGKKKQHWLGAGLNAQLDEAGSLDQKTNTFMLAAAFHYQANKKTVISIGAQGGARNRNFGSADKLNSEEQILTGGNTDNLLTNQTFTDKDNPVNGFLINAGLGLRTKINKKTNFHIGVAAMNINAPDQGIDGSGSGNNVPDAQKLPFRLNFHTGLSTQLNDKWTLNPTLLASTIRNQNEIDLQVWADYLLNADKEIDLRFGLGHRFGRDLQPLVGVNYGALRAAVGYDIRLGGLGNPIDNRGGVEIAIGYTGLIFKKPDVPPVFFCPQL